MAYVPTWKERLEDARPYVLPVVAGVLALAVGGWALWFTFAEHPSRQKTVETTARDRELIAARQALAAEVDGLEESYRRAAELGAPDDALDRALGRLIAKQRDLMKLFRNVSPEQNERLTRLEAARAALYSRAALARSRELELAAAEDQRAGRTGMSAEKLREALRLQAEANANAGDRAARDLARESQLAISLEEAEAEPLRAALDAALQTATKAAAGAKWDDALSAYERARQAQSELSRRFVGQPFADPAALDRIDIEIATLRSRDIAMDVAARERAAEAAVAAKRTDDAATDYAAAVGLQSRLNEEFPRSRHASAAKVAALELERQTAQSAAPLAHAAALATEVDALIRQRRAREAAPKIAEAVTLLENTGDSCPRSRLLDPALRTRMEYLALRTGEIDALQAQVFGTLVALPGGAKMFATEIPQELYRRVMNANPSQMPGRDLPVDSVTWHDAQEFCQRLSWLLGARVRLPTEQEFRSARANQHGVVWSADNAFGHSHPVGSASPPAAALQNIAGNLAEWLQPAVEPSETAPVAGGSFLDPAAALADPPVVRLGKRERARHVGFRIVVPPERE
jgi:formylglycine-generating enzyme required for sulfatase activity